MSETKQKLVVFLDVIGRTILGEDVSSSENSETLDIKNPVILHVQADQNGRMNVQLLPIFFREFLASKEDSTVFKFKNANITESNICTLDFRLSAQYNQLFGNNNVFVQPSKDEEDKNIVNLFDEN
jgi:hypothetical protein